MTSYLILPTEQEALDRSKQAHTQDTISKTSAINSPMRPAAAYHTLYRWARDVGKDGQTALIIDGDEKLLTEKETAALVSDLPDGPGENWEKPPPPEMS